jgi:hypothetical protein
VTFATPWLFGAAVAASLLVGGLHLLSVRQPPVLALPTARFATREDARAVARRPRPNDLLLLILRVLALLAAGAALAGMQLDAGGARTVRLVMVDSAAAADSSWRARQLRAVEANIASAARGEGDVEQQLHPVAGLARDPARAVVRATQVAATLAADRPALERVELLVVMPDRVETLEGWAAWRTQWPGAITVQRAEPVGQLVEASVGTNSGASPSVVASVMNEAAMVAMTSLFGPTAPDPRVTIAWPQDGAPVGWAVRPGPDTVSAVAARAQALVGPFVRVADAPPSRAKTRRAIAWWSDGAAAAVEERVGDRCLRTVGIRVPAASDLLLSAPAEGLLRALRAPCGLHGLPTDSLRSDDPGRGHAAAVAFRAGGAPRAGTLPVWLGPILLLFALALLGAEWLVRRSESA